MLDLVATSLDVMNAFSVTILPTKNTISKIKNTPKKHITNTKQKYYNKKRNSPTITNEYKNINGILSDLNHAMDKEYSLVPISPIAISRKNSNMETTSINEVEKMEENIFMMHLMHEIKQISTFMQHTM